MLYLDLFLPCHIYKRATQPARYCIYRFPFSSLPNGLLFNNIAEVVIVCP